MNNDSSLLFARPTPLDGLAGLLDVGDTLTEYNYSDTPEDADIEAIQTDWYVVGDDLSNAIAAFEKDHPPKR